MKARQGPVKGGSLWLPYHELYETVQQICQPAYESCGITYVDYARIYPNGKMALLTTAPHYADFFLHQTTAYVKQPSYILTPGFHLWHAYINQAFLQEVTTDYAFNYGLTFLQPQENYIEIFNVATQPENHGILSLYLNQQAVLRQFLHYFKEKAKMQITAIANNAFLLPKRDSASPSSLASSGSNFKSFEKQLLATTTPSVVFHHKTVTLTRREAQSLYLLKQGKSAKYIARVLNISYRTVEIYFANILKKTGAHSRLALLGGLDAESVYALERFLTN